LISPLSRPPRSPPFPYTTLFRSPQDCVVTPADMDGAFPEGFYCTTNYRTQVRLHGEWIDVEDQEMDCGILVDPEGGAARCLPMADRKSTRLNSSHQIISYAVFCL